MQIASKVCNGAFGGAKGANSVATDGVNYYTGKADARTAGEHAFQVRAMGLPSPVALCSAEGPRPHQPPLLQSKQHRRWVKGGVAQGVFWGVGWGRAAASHTQKL